MNTEIRDDRPVHIKVVRINNRYHFVTVLPPAEPSKDPDITWKVLRRRQHQDTLACYEGPGFMGDYSATKLDHTNA